MLFTEIVKTINKRELRSPTRVIVIALAQQTQKNSFIMFSDVSRTAVLPQVNNRRVDIIVTSTNCS